MFREDPLHKSLISITETDVLQPQIICSTSSRTFRIVEPLVNPASLAVALEHSILSVLSQCTHPLFLVPCEKLRFLLAFGFLSRVPPHVPRVYIAHLPRHERTVDVTVRVVNEFHLAEPFATVLPRRWLRTPVQLAVCFGDKQACAWVFRPLRNIGQAAKYRHWRVASG